MVFNAKLLDLGRKLDMVKSYFHEIIAVKETKASSTRAWLKLGIAWVGWCKLPPGLM